MGRLRIVLAFSLTAALMIVATPAQAAWPGTNGRIAFGSDRYGGTYNIVTMNPDGSGVRELTFLTANQGAALAESWSPDGSRLVFEERNQDASVRQIFLMNADGSNQHVLFSDPSYLDFNPTFSPDGSKIVFDSNKGGFLSAIWVMNADGTHQHRLTAPALEAVFPDWSPDGAHILFTDLCCLFGRNVWVMDADGSGQKQLTHSPKNHQGGFGSYSPDGKKIVLNADLKYPHNCCGDLYTMNSNGANLTQIVTDRPAVFFSAWGTASP